MGDEKRELQVLAVDDDPLVREFLAEVLAHMGCRVLTACDAAEGVKILEHQPMDLLITDYEMPQKNGLDLIRWSRARFPDLTAVMITGRNSQALAAEAWECGALRVLPKPLSVGHLLSLVEVIRGMAPTP